MRKGREMEMLEKNYIRARRSLTSEQHREIGSLPLTREQEAAFKKIGIDALGMQQFLYDVWRAREEDAELKARELAQIEEEKREEQRRERKARWLPDWCYDETGNLSWKFEAILGLVMGAVVFLPILWWPKWIGVLGAISILYWLFRIFGWLLLPMIGGLFGFGVSAHRFWRGWQYGRRHSR